MKQITINVPDNKIAFFKELVRNLGFQSVSHNKALTSEQKILIRQELKKAVENPNELLDWEIEQNKIDWNAC